MDRIPPHSLEAEEAVLGAMIVDSKTVFPVASIAKREDFYAPVHEDLFATIIGLEAERKPVDKISLIAELRAKNLLDRVGGVAYISRLMEIGLDAAVSVEYYAKIIAEKAALRRLIHAGVTIQRLAYDGEADAIQTLGEAERIFRGVTESRGMGDDGEWASDTALRIYREMDAAMAGERKKAVSLPWKIAQKHTGGLYSGEVLVIAGAPGMGKSALAVQIATHCAFVHGPVAFFALEMGKDDTIRRMVASKSGVNVRDIRSGSITLGQLDRVHKATSNVAEYAIKLFGSAPQKSTADIRRLCHRVRDERGLSLIVVDHPGYLREVGLGYGKASKHERYEHAYVQLKLAAAELDVPIILVQHLNREGMDRRPGLKDLRDGGNLEGHAHMVFFPYRPDILNNPSMGEIFIAKNRDGEPGQIPMTYGGADFLWSESPTMVA